MKYLSISYNHTLASLFFCSTLEVGSLTGCASNGLIQVGTDYTGGTTSMGSSSTGGWGGSNGTSGPTALDAGITSPTVLSQGENNQVATGGYWWTFADNNADGPYHALINPLTSLTIPLQSTMDGVDHGMVFRINGSVPPSLPWVDVANQSSYTIDQYWLRNYPDSRISSDPKAGIGFNFLRNSQLFDATGGGKWSGIAFDMKINTNMSTVWVSMPMDGTDLPDPNINDAFAKHCQYYTTDNPPTSGYQTCFTHYRKGFNEPQFATTNQNGLAAVGTWKRYCVLYSEVGIPAWANASTILNMPAFDPTRLTKVTWDMFQPNSGEEAAAFDISLDNVQLITDAEARDTSNNCDPNMIGQPPGVGAEG